MMNLNSIKFDRFDYTLIAVIGIIIGTSIRQYIYCHGWEDVIELCQPLYVGIL